MPAGRPPLGAELVDRTEGSPQAKKRVQVILQTVAGTLTIPQACALLDVGESRFHELRLEILQCMVQGAEAKRRGRPPAPREDPRQVQLRQELESLRVDLRATQIREELAALLPHLLRAKPKSKGSKKKH